MAEETETEEQNGPKQLREAYDRVQAERDAARAELAEAANAKRELALLKAGVDLDTPIGKLFAKSYDGELDKDAITASWNELTPQPTEPPPPPPTTPEQTNAALERLGLANARSGLNAEGAPADQTPDVDPVEQALADGRAAGPRGSDRAIQAYAQTAINAAVAGDPRITHQGVADMETVERWMENARQRQVRNNEKSTFQ